MDGLWLVTETVPLAESSLQIHTDIWQGGNWGIALCVTVSARAGGLDMDGVMLS